MRTISLTSRRTAVCAAATLSLAVASIAGVAMAPAANAATSTMTLSSATGPVAGTNSLTATTTVNTFASGLAVEFQYKASTSTNCAATYQAAATPATGVGIVQVSGAVHVVNAKKIGFAVPALSTLPVSVSATSAPWLACVYSGSVATTSPLTAQAAYTVATPPTISLASATPAGLVPNSGPALGGGTVTINGTGFVTGTTVKIGSQPLTGLVIVSSTQLTGVVPSQPASSTAMTVTLTNAQGTVTSTGVNGYTYTNGIVVSPNTAPTNTAATDVDVQGVGFTGLTFVTTDGSLPTDTNAHVYVVAGAYDPTAASKLLAGEKGECLNVLVISDGELICTVNTADADGAGSASTAIPTGTYTLTTVASGALTTTALLANPSIISSGSTFTVAPY